MLETCHSEPAAKGSRRYHILSLFSAAVLLSACLLLTSSLPTWGKEAGAAPVISLALSARDAFAKVQAGELLLIDIRDPSEWRETGVAKPAYLISIHRPGFASKLAKLTGGDRSRPIALICATGQRSRIVQAALLRFGYKNVYDVYDGMAGNARGPGWIRAGLPMRTWRPTPR